MIFSANALDNIRYGRLTATDNEVIQASIIRRVSSESKPIVAQTEKLSAMTVFLNNPTEKIKMPR